MSPTMTAREVADFHFDPDNLRRVRYSMVVFNWFGVALVPWLLATRHAPARLQAVIDGWLVTFGLAMAGGLLYLI